MPPDPQDFAPGFPPPQTPMSEEVEAAIVQETIPAQTTGSYLLLPPRAEEATQKPLLIVGFHGYSQNARMLLFDMLQIPGVRRHWLCAVQGLHLFYMRRTGEVVASWMTAANRRQAIADNLAYVRAIREKVQRERTGPLRTLYAGFSQGAALAYRVAAEDGGAGLIALGADVPGDVVKGRIGNLPPTLLGRGAKDFMYPPVQFEKDCASLERAGVALEKCLFEGKHEWAPEFLQAAGAFIERAHAQL